jgi:hypothetical protein
VERPPLEVADIVRAYGPAWRFRQAGHLSLGQLQVLSAIERCRTAELGDHQLHCDRCDTDRYAYNSCRNRHCPKCQASAAQRWLEARQAELLPIDYFHVVFTLPQELRDLAYQNKSVVYDLLFKTVADTLPTIAADPKHLGAKIGVMAVLHTWGSTLVHHPHLHCIVTGGGCAVDRDQWIRCRPNFFVPVKVLARLFRGRFLAALQSAYENGELKFFGALTLLNDPGWFAEYLRPLKKIDWVVYAKRPFAGPQAVLTYLSRYTHRVAISNRRLVAFDERGVTFRYKDYRIKSHDRWKSMTLPTDEFLRRFLLHVLPRGFHRIRHYGLFANAERSDHLNRARVLLGQPPPAVTAAEQRTEQPSAPCTYTCPACGSAMIIVRTWLPQRGARAPPIEIAA